MQVKRFNVCVVIAVSLMLIFSTGALAATTFKLGVMGPFTGPAAKTGTEFKGSVKMAMENIDYKIGDYKIEIVWIDSQSDPAKATSAYAEAVESKGVQVAMLNWHSSVAAAVMDIAAQYKVQHLFGMGAAAIVNEKYKTDPEKYSYWAAKGWPIPGDLIPGYVESINAAVASGKFKPEKKIIAIYGEESDWGRNVGEAFKKGFEATGWTILSEDYFPFTQTDFYPLLSKIKKGGAAVLAGTSTSAPSISAFIKQADELGLKSIIAADGLGWNGDWYKMIGNASNHVLDMIPRLTTKAAQEWAKEIKAKYGYTPSPSASGLSYDYANFFIKIARRTIEKHGKLDKDAIHEVVLSELNTGKLTYGKADGALIMNEYRYTAKSIPDPVIGADAYFFPVLQYMNGDSNIIYPESWKTADFSSQ